MKIRRASESDFEAMWPIFQAVIAPGDTYYFYPTDTRQDAYAYWFGPGIPSYVVEDDEQVVGMYRFVPNQRGLGSHVANASFMDSPAVRHKGIGKAMVQHCLVEARKAGYLAMQFNLVISTNKWAIALYEDLGFFFVGTLPRAFNHQKLGYVDAYVMYRFLDDIET